MLIAAILCLTIGLTLVGWGWSRVARNVGHQRLSWSGVYPRGTGWRLRAALAVGMGSSCFGGMTLVQQTQLPVWIAPLGIIAAMVPWVVVTLRHNRAVADAA